MARIFLAGLFHETNTFVDQATTLDAFAIRRDSQILDCRGDGSPLAGFLEAASTFDWEVFPGVDYRAVPSGTVADDVWAEYLSDLLPRLAAGLEKGIDGIFLVLHGAMSTATCPDVEGELLAAIRTTPGAQHLPIVAVLDLHANVSERMASHATALIPYRENPHTDAHESSVRASGILRQLLSVPGTHHTRLLHSGLLLAPPDTGTAGPIIGPLQKLSRQLEQEHGHLEIGVAPGFSHADTPDTGLTVWTISDRSDAQCLADLESLVAVARHEASSHRSSAWEVTAALNTISKERKFPALLVEPSDNIGGGAPGDGTTLLRALLETRIGRCGIAICDPAAVERLSSVDTGSAISLDIGGRGSRLDPGPLHLDVRLISRSSGCFDLEDRHSHMASMRGVHIEMGPCAVVRHDHVTILLTSRPTPPFDLGQWRSQGLPPEDFDIITIKAAVAHRRVYDPITGSSFTVLTPGPCSSDLRSLPYRLLRRPIIPLD